MAPNRWVKQVQSFNEHRLSAVLPPRPIIPDKYIRAQMIGNVFEENRELSAALAAGDDLADIIDACGDLIYVVIGVALQCGVDLTPHFAEIHRANMDKLPAGPGLGRTTAEGGMTKPPTWRPPDISGILMDQIERSA